MNEVDIVQEGSFHCDIFDGYVAFDKAFYQENVTNVFVVE